MIHVIASATVDGKIALNAILSRDQARHLRAALTGWRSEEECCDTCRAVAATLREALDAGIPTVQPTITEESHV